MEVGARRGAHFQLIRRGGTPSPITLEESDEATADSSFHARSYFRSIGPQSVLARRNLDRRGICQNGGRQAESVEVLPI